MAFQVLKYAGVAYLFYVAYATWRDKSAFSVNGAVSRAGKSSVQLLALSASFMAMTFMVFVVYGLVVHAFRRHVIESASVQSWLRYSFAAAFAGLGAKLAVSKR